MNWDRLESDARAVVGEVCGTLRPRIEHAAGILADRLRAGGKILACGNGGSAADAQHMAGELVNRFLRNRAPYAAVALTSDPSVMTSIANDFSFEEVFAKQVEALARPGDALIGFSTSGTSANVLRAFEAARRIGGIWTLALTGRSDRPLVRLADFALPIDASSSVPRIQEGHQLILHALCERIEERMEGADA
jgi:D-sedoheptulose 7-phosphate isomerase